MIFLQVAFSGEDHRPKTAKENCLLQLGVDLVGPAEGMDNPNNWQKKCVVFF